MAAGISAGSFSPGQKPAVRDEPRFLEISQQKLLPHANLNVPPTVLFPHATYYLLPTTSPLFDTLEAPSL
jgi:hypothetical protein